MAERIGQVLGRLHAIAPVTNDGGRWGEYLRNAERDLNRYVLAHVPDPVLELPYEGTSIAHNDPALSNMILSPVGKIELVDFERSQFKPDGWDLLLATRVLAGQQPQHWEEIAHALFRGYRKTAGKSALPDGFVDLVGAVFVAMIA